MAASPGPRAVAAVLTGYDGDGSGDLADVKAGGGRAVVQHPDTARVPDMPDAALSTGEADQVVPLERITHVLTAAATRVPNEPQ